MKTELATYVNVAKRTSQLGNKGSEKKKKLENRKAKKRNLKTFQI